jgi:hypothetical protein
VLISEEAEMNARMLTTLWPLVPGKTELWSTVREIIYDNKGKEVSSRNQEVAMAVMSWLKMWERPGKWKLIKRKPRKGRLAIAG